MCFGGGKTDTTPAATPAAAPDAPAPVQSTQVIGQQRQTEDTSKYGSSTPSLLRDDSTTSGGATAGGAGLRTM